MPELHSPLVLLLLLPLAAGWWWLARRRRPPSVTFPSLAGIRPARTMRLRLIRLPSLLRALAVVLIVFAAARPRLGVATSAIRREGFAIQMVLDRSGSMDEELSYRGRPVPKIEIVKEIFTDFVAGGDGLAGRPHDLLGLTTFARFAEENCPLVGLHEPLLTAVGNLETVPPFLDASSAPVRARRDAAAPNPLSATAIGEGLKRAVLALVAAEEDLARARGKEEDSGYEIRGKVAILLTDGKHNAGIDPQVAAELAKENGVRVYAIVLAERQMRQQTIFGEEVVRRLSDEEMAELMKVPEEIASATGGRAFLATDGDALREVYEEIDRQERIDLGEIEFRTYRERFALPLLLGLALLLLAFALEETWLRRVP